MSTLNTQYEELKRKNILDTKDLSLREAAEKLGICITTVYNLRKKYGLTKPSAARRLKNSGIDIMLNEMSALTNREIALRLGVHEQTISNWRRELGMPTKVSRKKELDKEMAEKIIATKDLTCREVADQLGVSRTTVATWRRELKVGKQIKSSIRRSNEELKELLIETRDLSSEDAAKQLGISTQYVRYRRGQLGIRDSKKSAMEELIVSGKLQKLIDTRYLTSEEAAEKTGMSRAFIDQWRKQLNISNPRNYRGSPGI